MKIKNTFIISVLIASLFIGGCTNSGLSDNSNTDNNNTIKQEEKTDSNKKENKSESDMQSDKQDNESESKEEETIKPVEERRNFVISTCTMCDKLIHESDEFKECNDSYICMDCYNKGYCKCLNCGKTINGYDEGIVNGSSGSFCSEECADQFTGDYCSKCGVEVEIGNSQSCTYDDNGNLLCLDCYFAEHEQVGDAPED